MFWEDHSEANLTCQETVKTKSQHAGVFLVNSQPRIIGQMFFVDPFSLCGYQPSNTFNLLRVELHALNPMKAGQTAASSTGKLT